MTRAHRRGRLLAAVGAALLTTLLLAATAAAQTPPLELFRQGQAQLAEGKAKDAEATYRKALAGFEKAEGAESLNVGTTWADLALALKAQARYKDAEAAYLEALAIQRKAVGPKHPAVALTLQNLANLYLDLGRLREAEPLFREALQILAQRPGPELVGALINASRLTMQQVRYAESEELMLQAVALAEQLYGPDHPFIGHLLINLISLYHEQGRSREAEKLTQRVTKLYKPLIDKESPDTLFVLTMLASQEVWQGRTPEAITLMQRAVDLSTRIHGPEHPQTGQMLVNLATFQLLQGKPADAEALLRRALAIQEKALGKDHLDLADTLASLGGALLLQDRFADAEAVANRQIALLEKRLGKKHPRVAEPLLNLAALHQLQGNHKQARRLLDRALAIVRATFGDAHPEVAEALHKLALSDQSEGRIKQAVELHTRAADLDELLLDARLTVASEPQKRTLLDQLNTTTQQIVALHFSAAPTNEPAARLALTTLLRRKGRALDALADDMALLRGHLGMQEAAMLDQLQELRSSFATLSLAPGAASDPGLRKQLEDLRERIQRQEQELLARSEAFRGQSQPVTLEAVQKALPADAALVEFATWEPYDPTPRKGPDDGVVTWGSPHTVAYVLHPDGALQWVDLGPTAAIDDRVQRLRKALLRCPSQEGTPTGPCATPAWNADEVKAEARATWTLLWGPLAAPLDQVQHVILAPEGSLNLLPFGALLDDQGHFLIERHRLSLVTTGRDLLRLDTLRRSTSTPVIIADPDYDLTERTPSAPTAPARRSGALDGLHWSRLPATAAEGAALAARLPGARTLTRADADERNLKSLHAPAVLHIATHGFFLQDQPLQGASGTRGFIRPASSGAADPVALPEHPLVRSGLVFSGANARGARGDDGILTALELASVDLWGTQLVVLSACETGLGDVQNGQGVYGLRRALVLAGTASQITSLWQVDDKGTRALMEHTWTGLANGLGAPEALRRAQRQLLASPTFAHPWFWASFSASGQWAPLEGVRLEKSK